MQGCVVDQDTLSNQVVPNRGAEERRDADSYHISLRFCLAFSYSVF